MKFCHLAAFGAACTLFSAASAQAAAVDLSTVQFNGSATAPAPGVIQLTDGPNLGPPDPITGEISNIGEVGSAFISTAFDSTNSFSTSFLVTLAGAGFDPQADGITFLIQGENPGVLGGGGGGVGAEGLTNNVGVALQSWDNNHATIFRDGGVFKGTLPPGNFDLGMYPLNEILVNVSYSAHLLSFTATNTTTGQSVTSSRSYAIENIAPEVYLGFTGATGLSYSVQQISNWDLTVVSDGSGAVPEPASWALMITGFGGMGAMLRRRRTVTA
jgi:hypothetical protein